GRTPRTCRDVALDQRLLGQIVVEETRGELSGVKRLTGLQGGSAAATARTHAAGGDIMILPRHEFAGGVHGTFQVMETSGPVLIVMEIVLARPREFHGGG